MQNSRNFVPATVFFENQKIDDKRHLIANYIRHTHCNSDLTWENGLREETQLVSTLLDSEKAIELLGAIQKSEINEFNVLFFTIKSRTDHAKHRIIFDLNKLDAAGLTAAAEIIKDKLNVMAIFLNTVHCPDKTNTWTINQSLHLQYKSGSLSYTDGNGSDIKRATQISKLLHGCLSIPAQKQGLTLEFITQLGKSLKKNDGKSICCYTLTHNEFLWKNLFVKAVSYTEKVRIIASMAAENAFKGLLNTDPAKYIGFFLDAKSTHALALTTKKAAKALDTPEAIQVFGNRRIV